MLAQDKAGSRRGAARGNPSSCLHASRAVPGAAACRAGRKKLFYWCPDLKCQLAAAGACVSCGVSRGSSPSAEAIHWPSPSFALPPARAAGSTRGATVWTYGSGLCRPQRLLSTTALEGPASPSSLQGRHVGSSLGFVLCVTSHGTFSLSPTQPATATPLARPARPATRRRGSARARTASPASPATAVPRATSRAARRWPPASVSAAVPCPAPGDPRRHQEMLSLGWFAVGGRLSQGAAHPRGCAG